MQHFGVEKMRIVAYKYATQSKYINKTETEHKQRPTAHDMDQGS